MSAGAVRVIRASACRRMTWKNGGGETVEIAVEPEGAGLDDFVWRLSTARVAQDGPFSLFKGVDRTLAVIEGAGLVLAVGDDPPIVLRRDTHPYRFPADRPSAARLIDGPVTDLNIMTRRGVVGHHMRRIELDTHMPGIAAKHSLVYCAAGRVDLGAGGVLEAQDCALIAAGDFEMTPVAAHTLVFVVDLT